MTWYKILFPIGDERSPALGLRLATIVQEQDIRHGKPKGVAVFSTSEYSEDLRQGWFAYYLSPVAAVIALPHLDRWPLVPCDKPALDAEDLSLMYGTLMSSESWDLLK